MNLAAVMKKKGVSGRELARRTGFDERYIRKLKANDVEDPQLSTVVKLAQGLEVSLDDLAGFRVSIALDLEAAAESIPPGAETHETADSTPQDVQPPPASPGQHDEPKRPRPRARAAKKKGGA